MVLATFRTTLQVLADHLIKVREIEGVTSLVGNATEDNKAVVARQSWSWIRLFKFE